MKQSNLKTVLRSAIFAVSALVLLFTSSGSTLALAPELQKLRKDQINWFSPTKANICSTVTPTASSSSQTPGEVEAKKQHIYQLLRGLGFSPEKAAAIWGNMIQEAGSALDPKALEHSGEGVPGYTGHGLAQWSWSRWRTDYGDSKDAMRTPNAARQSDLTDFSPYPPKSNLDPNTLLGFAKQNNKNWYDLDLQIAFLAHEAQIGQGADSGKMKEFMSMSSTDVVQLTTRWEEAFEGASPDSANMPNRLAGAQEAMQKYSGLPAISTGISVNIPASSGDTNVGASGGCSSATNASATITSCNGKYMDTGAGGIQFLSIDKAKGMFGVQICYVNQGNGYLNSLIPNYSWSECNCGPTTTLTIQSAFEGNPNLDAKSIFETLVADKAVYPPGSGDCGGTGGWTGFQKYFKDLGYDVVPIQQRERQGSVQLKLTNASLDKARDLLKNGYLLFGAVPGHYLTIYAGDDKGNFYISDSGWRANMTNFDGSGNTGKHTADQIQNGGGNLTGATAGGFIELWAVKKVGAKNV